MFAHDFIKVIIVSKTTEPNDEEVLGYDIANLSPSDTSIHCDV